MSYDDRDGMEVGKAGTDVGIEKVDVFFCGFMETEAAEKVSITGIPGLTPLCSENNYRIEGSPKVMSIL